LTGYESGFVSRFLRFANQLGIREVDTAPYYGDSENLIGQAKEVIPDWLINSKVGLPNPDEFNPDGIRKQVYQSLERLKASALNTVWIHSLPKNFLTVENIEVLTKIKSEGVVKKIGYSGDGDDLLFALEEYGSVLDSIMCTINPLDLSNYALLIKYQPRDLHLKRVLGNAVWQRPKFFDQVQRIKNRQQYRSIPSGSYETRFREIFDNRKGSLNLRIFLDFANSVFPDAKLCIGTKSMKHLQEIVDIVSKPKYLEQDQILAHMDLWRRLAQENAYQPLI
jgi:hypothetical protein